jgi:hypothetical protein
VIDGSHLVPEWNRIRASVHDREATATVAASFADEVASGPNAWWGLRAALQYPAAERLRLITQPALLVGSRDAGGLDSGRLRALLPKARAVEPAEIFGTDLFESAATQVGGVLREFLRA